MEEHGDMSFLQELSGDQFVDYLFKRYDLVKRIEQLTNN